MNNSTQRSNLHAPVSTEGFVVAHVWDWPVRVFHWALVALVIAAIVTANVGGNAMVWHMRAGYAILTLVLFRVLWGFVGSRHARFASFLRGPRTALRYAQAFLRRAHPVVVGHNPLGGWSVMALLLVLLVQVGTGLGANDDIMVEGPLVKFISKDLSDRLTGLHQLNVWAIGILVGMHVAAVVVHGLFAREDLVRPMLTGKKRLPSSLAHEGLEAVLHLRAVAVLAGCGLAVWWLVGV